MKRLGGHSQVARLMCLVRLSALGWLAAWPFLARGHRLDECLQATLVAIEPRSVRLSVNLVPGVEVSEKVIRFIDQDGDGLISSQEGSTFAQRLKSDLLLRLGHHPLPLKVASIEFAPVDDLRAGQGNVRIELVARLDPLSPGQYELTFENRHQPELSVYLFNALAPGFDALQIVRQVRNRNQSEGTIVFQMRPAPETESGSRRPGNQAAGESQRE